MQGNVGFVENDGRVDSVVVDDDVGEVVVGLGEYDDGKVVPEVGNIAVDKVDLQHSISNQWAIQSNTSIIDYGSVSLDVYLDDTEFGLYDSPVYI